MEAEYSAKTIQHFYKVYIKTDRDKTTKYPIDPITQEPIPPKLQIPLLCYDSKYITKPIKTQYFNLETLDTWFKTRREAINPLTNLPFSIEQLTSIQKAYKNNKMKCPAYIVTMIKHNNNKIKTSESDESDEDEPIIIDCGKIAKDIYTFCKNPEDISKFTNLLVSNYHYISNDSIRLDTLYTSPYYFLNKETILMRCILNDNIQAVEELLYYSPNLDVADDRFNLKAIDLAVMSNKPLSNLIIRTLLFHGARLDLPTKKGSTLELTNDLDKLSILYEFITS